MQDIDLRGLDFESPEMVLCMLLISLKRFVVAHQAILKIFKNFSKKEIIFDPVFVEKLIGININFSKIQNILLSWALI